MASSEAQIPDEIRQRMEEADRKEVLTSKTLVAFVNGLATKINTNMEQRFQYADEPAKFMDSELALHEALKQCKDIPVDKEMMKLFLSDTAGMTHLLGLLIHKNPDIVSDSLSALSDLTDPELLVPMHDDAFDSEDVANDLIDKDVLAYLADILSTFTPTQHENEGDFQNVTLVLQIFENLMELSSSAFLSEVRVSKTIIPYLLGQILHKEPFSYNKIYCMELLEMIMQQSPSCAVWIGSTNQEEVPLPDDKEEEERFTQDQQLTHGLTGVKNFINALAIYRKQEIETAEQEEFVSNIYLCLQIAFLTPSAIKIFADNQGVALMIRMIRERNQCLTQALRTLVMILENNPGNCDAFVQSGGLKSLSGVFMYRGVVTKAKGRDSLIDEYTTSILYHILKNGNTQTNLRVCMKFAESRGEKITRLFDTIQTYQSRVSRASAQVDAEISAMKKIAEIGEEAEEDELSYDDRLYLRKCDLGYHALLNAIRIFLHLANTGNQIIQKLLIGLQCSQNIHPLQTIAFYVEDYLSHLSESTKIIEEKKDTRQLLTSYLKAYDELLKSNYLAQYSQALTAGEAQADEEEVESIPTSTVVPESVVGVECAVEEDVDI